MTTPSRAAVPDRKVTALDVAREAGVSKWTVNRAFKTDGSIAPDSRFRILEAARRLGYRPNLLARSLTTKATQQVAVLVDDFGNPHKLPMLDLLTAALQREGLLAVLVNINEANTPGEAFLDADQRQVDAVVLLGTTFRDETLREHAAHPSSPPLFVLARESTVASVVSVSCDAVESMRSIGSHLWERGYRRPGFMSGPKTLSTALGRMQQFAAFWQARGQPHVPDFSVGGYDRARAFEVFGRYLATTAPAARIDVLMCENDALAFGAMDAARFGFDLRVPSDLAFVGYDGIELAAAAAYDLTTYEQPITVMVERIVAMITGRAEAIPTNFPGRLIVRRST